MSKATDVHLRSLLEVLTAGSQLPVRPMEELIAGDPRAEELLVEVLKSRAVRDESWGPIWTVVALGERRSVKTLPAILDCMLNGTDLIHEAVEFSLLRFNANDVVQPVLAFLDDHPAMDGRVHLYSVLAGTRAPAAIDYLIGQLRRDEDCVASVAWALVTTGEPRALAAVERELARRKNSDIEEALAAARNGDDLTNPLLADWKEHWKFDDNDGAMPETEPEPETMRDEGDGLNLQPRLFDVHCPICESHLEYDSMENGTRVLKGGRARKE